MPPLYTIVRDMDLGQPSGQITTDDPEEASELIDMAHARRPGTRVTIYDQEGRIRRRVKSGNWAD